MPGRRRAQRSVRVTVASALVGLCALAVAASVLTSTDVAAGAVLSVVAGAVALRIVHTEVVQTRRDAAVQRAAQARSFQSALRAGHREHETLARTLQGRLQERQAAISLLAGALRVAERRADDAEERVEREAGRANQAQERLAAVLDEVLGTTGYDADADREGQPPEMPAIVDLLQWQSRVRA